MNYTIINNSGGNHGHQLKDWIGSYTIGEILGLQYHHTYYEYLDFFLPHSFFKQNNKLKNMRAVVIDGPLWGGIADYADFKEEFKTIEKDVDTLYQFSHALRVHPFQTIAWLDNHLIKKDIFRKVCSILESAFYHNKERRKPEHDITDVCVHVNLRHNQGTGPRAVRYRFPADYYLRIVEQLQESVPGKLRINIYTEETNSALVEQCFPDTEFNLHIGPDREKRDLKKIHSIFKDFVDTDILVSSNSSFSVVASYFRQPDSKKITVYHPHAHLKDLGKFDNMIETNGEGTIQTYPESWSS